MSTTATALELRHQQSHSFTSTLIIDSSSVSCEDNSSHEYLRSLIYPVAKQACHNPIIPFAATRLLTNNNIQLRFITPITFSRATMMSVESAPGSPPDLTTSKSSKSSSFHSSSLADAAGPNDVTHFEDITLDDLHDGSKNKRELRPRPYLSRSAMGASRGTHQATPSSRDLTNTIKQYPSLKTQVSGALREQSSLGIPNARTMRRGFTSPSSPSLAAPAPPSHTSRTPSPAKLSNFYGMSRSFSRSNPRFIPDISPLSKSPARRQSWQPGRKTVKELEDEYHDSDEDVPEDAVIWNVPISPRRPGERSTSHSPDRMSLASSANSESFDRNRHHSAPVGTLSVSSSTSNTPDLRRIPSNMSIMNGSDAGRERTKSWTAAMTHLSDEAKALTEALEVYADSNDRKIEERIQSGRSSRRSSHDKQKVSSSTIELPPVRKGNIMIDPLPISKEKEKVLTRTRPSWLPPKDPKEEKKHLKEYQQIMARSIEAERQKSAKRLEEQQSRDKTQGSISRIWDQHVLPNWDYVIREPRTRELWWRGITPRSRGVVWERAIENTLELTNASYAAALDRAKARDKELSMLDVDQQNKAKEAAWFFSIKRDVMDTFPEVKIFQPEGPLHDALVDVLMAYCMYRSDVGYVYGTHLIAALLLINVSASSAFIMLANLLNRPLPMGFLVHDIGAMSRAHQLVQQTLRYKVPKLHQYLHDTLQLDPAEYMDPLFRTMFCNGLGIDIASRIWDVYVFEGDKALIRAAVGALVSLEGKLYGTKDEVLDLLGWPANKRWDVGNEDDFMRNMRTAGKIETEVLIEEGDCTYYELTKTRCINLGGGG
ncbi:hypothetical protein M501DRAFT_993572 [Patellaria atrata CBS 101060]|uniref:Rab-GAP TBC domain-containing protein n=1 Tax=Patellaria atrata CBS 101060 TaxID=1346257 RepID=A0A9P4VRC9_9PEZI|nr:hypothetical protein M501DRAFT_993572 [Patellaria atrata CBS 101060]